MEQLARSANTGPDPLEYGVVLREDYNAHVSVLQKNTLLIYGLLWVLRFW